MLLLMRITHTLAENFMIFLINNICLKRRYDKNFRNIMIEVIITSVIIQVILHLSGYSPFTNIYLNIFVFISLTVFYKGSNTKKLILTCLYSLVYLLPVIIVITINLLIENGGSTEYKQLMGENAILKLIYMVSYVWIFICIKYKKIIIKVFLRISHMKCAFHLSFLNLLIQDSLIILFFYKNYMIIKCDIITYNIIFFSYLITMIIMIVYMIQLKYQRKVILNLNEKLEIKNQELSKIKHDYGAQISYLYGLYLLKRYDELKVELKKIKENNKNTLSAVEINYSKIRSISDGMSKILDKGIHLVINEYGDIGKISLSKEELFKAIENVIDYIVKDDSRESYILMRTYNSFEKLNIELINIKKKSKKNGDIFLITSLKKYIQVKETIYNNMKTIESQYNDNLKIICRCGLITGNLKINMIVK